MASSHAASLRIIALPLTRPGLPSRPPFVYYYVQSPPRPPSKHPHWIAKSTAKVAATWAAWGEASKDSWKVRFAVVITHQYANVRCLPVQYKTFKWGERIADRVEFEETALRVIDNAYKPPENQNVSEKDTTLVPLLYPSLLAGADPLGNWQSHIQSRIPYHKRYMNLWLLG